MGVLFLIYLYFIRSTLTEEMLLIQGHSGWFLKGSTNFLLKNSEKDKSIFIKRYGYQKVMAFAEVLFYCDFITFISEAD